MLNQFDYPKEQISISQARQMVTDTGWHLIKRGYESFSRDGLYMVYGCHGIYHRRKRSIFVRIA